MKNFVSERLNNLNPKISVIIPAYNSEKYIHQCLISILSSNFTDYEIILVDDCSTDQTVAEVEKLLSHFEGRLKIISTEKNSGGAGVPRNLGIKFATGKYVTFVDNDDMILPTTLENFFEVAEKFSADVVHAEKYFAFYGDDFQRENLQIYSNEPDLTDEIVSDTKILEEKISRYLEGKIFCVPWGNLYKRNFLIENKIKFPELQFGEDGIFSFKVFCLAENYVRVPFVTNIHRIREDSLGRKILDTDEGFHLLLNYCLNVCEELENFSNKIKIDKKNFVAVVENFLNDIFETFTNFFANISKYNLYRIFLAEISKPEFEKFSRGKNILLAYLCTKQFTDLR